jgi:hypothetical protein
MPAKPKDPRKPPLTRPRSFRDDTGDVPALLGRPARTIEQFATDHAAAFS